MSDTLLRGSYAAWAKNYCARNSWRIDGYDFEDLLQEAALKFHQICVKYGDVDPPHRMRLFQVSLCRHLDGLAGYNRKQRDAKLFVAEMATVGSYHVTNTLGYTEELAEALRALPKELFHLACWFLSPEESDKPRPRIVFHGSAKEGRRRKIWRDQVLSHGEAERRLRACLYGANEGRRRKIWRDQVLPHGEADRRLRARLYEVGSMETNIRQEILKALEPTGFETEAAPDTEDFRRDLLDHVENALSEEDYQAFVTEISEPSLQFLRELSESEEKGETLPDFPGEKTAKSQGSKKAPSEKPKKAEKAKQPRDDGSRGRRPRFPLDATVHRKVDELPGRGYRNKHWEALMDGATIREHLERFGENYRKVILWWEARDLVEIRVND